MLWTIMSIACLILTIWLGCIKKQNLGIVSLSLSFVLLELSGHSEQLIFDAFDTNLFFRLVGVSLLCNIARNNGTIDILAYSMKFFRGKKIFLLFPFFLFFFTAVLQMAGMSVATILVVLVISISFEWKIHPFKLLPCVLLGLNAVCLSPFHIHGAVMASKAQKAGIAVNNWNAVILNLLCNLVVLVIFYFASRWYKCRITEKQTETNERLIIKKEHVLTVAGIVLMALLSATFGWHIGILAITISFVLILLKAGNGNEAFRQLPWNTVLMVMGMSVLAEVVRINDGTALLVNAMTIIKKKELLPGMMVLIGGFMSMISSASSVVIPTIIPVIQGICSSVKGTNATELVYALSSAACVTAFSPFSNMGGFIIATYDSIFRPSADERTKMFKYLMFYSLASVGVYLVAAMLGVFRVILFS